jgi:5-methylcytosine-specific restriction endonuclease McrA
LNGVTLTADTILDLKADFDGFCPYCWDKIETGHIDHIVPVSKGGTNERNNLAWVCATCNVQKGNKSLAEFRLYQVQEATL